MQRPKRASYSTRHPLPGVVRDPTFSMIDNGIELQYMKNVRPQSMNACNVQVVGLGQRPLVYLVSRSTA